MLTHPQNTQVSETKEFRSNYHLQCKSKADFKDYTSLFIWCYRGNEPQPKWRDVDTERYTKLCTIAFDLSHLPMSERSNKFGLYYRVEYEIVLQFGLTELKAQIAWKEDVSGHSMPFLTQFNCRIATGRGTKVGFIHVRGIAPDDCFQVTGADCLRPRYL